MQAAQVLQAAGPKMAKLRSAFAGRLRHRLRWRRRRTGHSRRGFASDPGSGPDPGEPVGNPSLSARADGSNGCSDWGRHLWHEPGDRDRSTAPGYRVPGAPRDNEGGRRGRALTYGDVCAGARERRCAGHTRHSDSTVAGGRVVRRRRVDRHEVQVSSDRHKNQGGLRELSTRWLAVGPRRPRSCPCCSSVGQPGQSREAARSHPCAAQKALLPTKGYSAGQSATSARPARPEAQEAVGAAAVRASWLGAFRRLSGARRPTRTTLRRCAGSMRYTRRTPFYGSRRIAFTLKMNRKRAQRRMRLMGIEALGRKPRTSKSSAGAQDLSVSAARPDRRTAQSGVGVRHHLRAHPRGQARGPLVFSISWGHGLVVAGRAVVAPVEHDGHVLLPKGARGSPGGLRQGFDKLSRRSSTPTVRG